MPQFSIKIKDHSVRGLGARSALEWGTTSVVSVLADNSREAKRFGGALVLELLDRHPDAVRTMVLAGAYAGWAGSLDPGEVEDRYGSLRTRPGTWAGRKRKRSLHPDRRRGGTADGTSSLLGAARYRVER